MTAKVKAKLTKRTVDAVQPPTEGEVWVWDTEIKGLILRVRATGGRSMPCAIASDRAR